MEDRFTVLKITLVGPAKVGKTKLCESLVNRESYHDDYISTIGVNFFSHTLHEKKKKFQIWDLGGQPKFNFITKTYVKNSKLMLLCYSCASELSFRQLKEMYEDYRLNGFITDTAFIIIVTQVDNSEKFSDWDVSR